MSGTLNKFRKRNIETNLGHFSLVIFVVAISVSLVFGLLINYLTLNSSVENFYANSALPNLWIETDGIRSEDEEFLARYNYSKRYCFDSSFTVGSGTHSSKFIVSDGKVSKPYIVEGGREKGCYVDAKFIDKFNIGINSSKISFFFSINSEARLVQFDVVGSLALAEDLLVDDECVIFIDEKVFFETLKTYFNDYDETDFESIKYNQILISSDVKQEEKLAIEEYFLNSETELFSIKSKSEINSFNALDKEIKTAKLMILTFPSLFVCFTILVVVSAISQFVAKEKYNIGLLKSLGKSNKELLNNYSSYGSILCLIGALVGVLFSPLIIPNVLFEKYDKIFNLPKDEVKMSIPILAVVLTLIISALIGYFSAFFVCKNVINKTPKYCMSDAKKIKIKSRKKSRFNFGILGWAFRSLKANKARTAMSIMGLFGCLTLIEIGFGISSKLENNFLTITEFSSIFKGFSIVLLFFTIAIFTAQIVKEKSKEMTILRVHGESYIKIWLSSFLEMLIVSMIGFAFAACLSQPIFLMILKIFEIDKIIFIDFLSYLKSFLILISMNALLSIFVLFKVCRLNLSEATKIYE